MSDRGPEEFVNFSFKIQTGLASVQCPIHQFVWKAHSVQFGAPGPSASVQVVQLSSRTLPALTRIDLAGLVRLRIGSVRPVSNWLRGIGGGAVLGPLQRKSRSTGPGFVACLFACLLGFNPNKT